MIDADDTLWENNVYFERVIATVQQRLAPSGVTPVAFREHLDALERESIRAHGYGTLNFTRSLVRAFAHFCPGEGNGGHSSEIERLALGILTHPIEVLDGVPETLEYLAGRHNLTLVTKGDRDEQSRKIAVSGLSRFFRATIILREKHADSYRDLVRQHQWDPDQTWMVGNSPRSDINPAVAAGIGAVYIPHTHTWVLEHEPPVVGPRVLELDRFSRLRQLF